MYSKLIKILLLAVAVAVVATMLAVTMMKPQDAPEIAKPVKQYPHRDMLQDTVMPAQPAPVAAAAPVPGQEGLQLNNLAGTLKISSPTLQPGGRIPLEHSCYRKNKSPALSWSGAPRGTKSFVVLFEDIDAVKGDSLQWAVYNIPASAASLAGGLPREPLLSDGFGQALNDGGNIGYIGPCKPKGQFPYLLRVFALDIALNLPGGVKKDELFGAMNGHIIDMAAMDLMHFYRM